MTKRHKKHVRRAVRNWLPQDGKRVEVSHPATGKIGFSEHAGFIVMMIIAIALLAVAFILAAH